MIRILAAALLLTLAAAVTPAAAACTVRVPVSLSSDSEHVGPTIPCTAKEAAKLKQRTAKTVDPLKVARNNMVSGKKVTDKELRQLAESGDDLAAYNLAKRIEEAGEASAFPTAIAYYAQAVEAGRDFALRPIVRLLDAGAAADEPELLERTEKLLADKALKDPFARDTLIRMYRAGRPFGLQPERADVLLVDSAEAGDAQAALDLAFALLTGTPDAATIERAKGYLKVAMTSDTLNVRTMAENLLRTLEPQLTASTETVQ